MPSGAAMPWRKARTAKRPGLATGAFHAIGKGWLPAYFTVKVPCISEAWPGNEQK